MTTRSVASTDRIPSEIPVPKSNQQPGISDIAFDKIKVFTTSSPSIKASEVTFEDNSLSSSLVSKINSSAKFVLGMIQASMSQSSKVSNKSETSASIYSGSSSSTFSHSSGSFDSTLSSIDRQDRFHRPLKVRLDGYSLIENELGWITLSDL